MNVEAEIIKAYIDQKHLSVPYFCKMCGIAKATVYRYFNGTSRINKKVAKRIERATGKEIRFENLRPISRTHKKNLS